MSYIGRLGIGVRGADHRGFFDADQLYNLNSDPKELKNLAKNQAHVARLQEMKFLMRQDLQRIGRPFGEFIPGGNATEPGQVDKQIKIVKQLENRGKKVTVPERLEKKPGVANDSNQNGKAEKSQTGSPPKGARKSEFRCSDKPGQMTRAVRD